MQYVCYRNLVRHRFIGRKHSLSVDFRDWCMILNKINIYQGIPVFSKLSLLSLKGLPFTEPPGMINSCSKVCGFFLNLSVNTKCHFLWRKSNNCNVSEKAWTYPGIFIKYFRNVYKIVYFLLKVFLISNYFQFLAFALNIFDGRC